MASLTDRLKTTVVILILGVFTYQGCPAAEIDSITPRRLKLDNSLDSINEIFNERLQAGIQAANARQQSTHTLSDIIQAQSGRYCDEAVLYTALRKAIFQSFTTSLGLKGYDLDKQLRGLLADKSYALSLNDSIYRDIDYIEGLSLKLKELSHVVNLNGHLVGLDKMGHFFAQGWRYFELSDYGNEPLHSALAWGKEKEAGLFGYTTTGIFSFADLAANLNGWRFWNKVLLKHDDPLKGVIGNFFNRSYVSCDIRIIESIKQRKLIRAWTYNARFDVADYLDGAWDEGNNCNSYADPMIEEKVSARIRRVAPAFTCPLDTRQCARARDKYGEYAKHVLHPYCLTVQ